MSFMNITVDQCTPGDIVMYNMQNAKRFAWGIILMKTDTMIDVLFVETDGTFNIDRYSAGHRLDIRVLSNVPELYKIERVER